MKLVVKVVKGSPPLEKLHLRVYLNGSLNQYGHNQVVEFLCQVSNQILIEGQQALRYVSKWLFGFI
jgi:hypothetical protein